VIDGTRLVNVVAMMEDVTDRRSLGTAHPVAKIEHGLLPAASRTISTYLSAILGYSSI
jgi:hypothetical protein